MKRQLCPLMFQYFDHREYIKRCIGEVCAWLDNKIKNCVMHHLSENTDKQKRLQ